MIHLKEGRQFVFCPFKRVDDRQTHVFLLGKVKLSPAVLKHGHMVGTFT